MYTDLFDLLQQLGVDVVDAYNFVGSLRKKPETAFYELFGQVRIAEAATHGRRRAWN